jgi:hypothetical protein
MIEPPQGNWWLSQVEIGCSRGLPRSDSRRLYCGAVLTLVFDGRRCSIAERT